MKHITKFKSNECIHCPTEEEAIAICKIMDQNGLRWFTGSSYISEINWYGDIMCYYPKDGEWTSVNYAKERGYKIHKASDIIAYHTPLPEKWAVKPENEKQAKKVGKYFSLMCNTGYSGEVNSFYHSIFNGDCHRWSLLSGYTIIPYAQFKAEYDRVFPKKQKEVKNDFCKEQPELADVSNLAFNNNEEMKSDSKEERGTGEVIEWSAKPETIKGTFTITIEPETVTKVFEPEKEPDYTQYIGKKMRGFRFDGKKYTNCCYWDFMDKHIGEIGEITMFSKSAKTFRVEFKDIVWSYPANLAINHIIEEPQPITYTAQEVDKIIVKTWANTRDKTPLDLILEILNKNELLKH